MIKLLKLLLVFHFCVISSLSHATDRVDNIIDVINEEIEEVSRLFVQTDRKDPSLLLRMAELHLEKARLYKSVENENYLKIPFNKRKKISKDKFFNKSKKEFIKARNLCLTILKKHKNYKDINEVFYVLAFNYKEFNETKKAKKFLRQSIKSSRSSSKSELKAKLALAEIEYNNENYAAAIPLYEVGLRKINDKWWTKDAHNLAWCYLRVGKHSKALETMKKVYRRSKNNKYVDMSFAVERDIALFFVEANKLSEALSFYQNTGSKFSSSIKSMASRLEEQGRYVQASRTLVKALKLVKSNVDKGDLTVALMKIDDHFERSDKVLEHAKWIQSIYSKIDSIDREAYDFLVEKHAAIVQKKVVSKKYKNNRKVKVRNAKLAVEFFELMKKLSIGDQLLNEFYIAETWYAINYVNTALPQYEKVFGLAKKNGNKTIMKEAANGMIACLSRKSIKEVNRNKYLASSFEKYLEVDRQSDRADKIYKRLFNLHIDKKQYQKAESVYLSYKKSFPKKGPDAQDMLVKVVDGYVQTMNLDKVRSFISQAQEGSITISPAILNKFIETLTKLEVKDVEKRLSKGDKAYALKSYIKIYNDKASTERSKINASYNLSVLFYELGMNEEMILWSKRAIKRMSVKQLVSFVDSFVTISNYLADIGSFQESIELQNTIYDKLCHVKYSEEAGLYRSMFVLNEATNQYDKAIELWKTRNKCRLPYGSKNESTFILLEYSLSNELYDKSALFVRSLEKQQRNYPRLIIAAHKLYDFYKKNNQLRLANSYKDRVSKYYKHSSRKKYSLSSEALDVVAEFQFRELDSLVNSLKKHQGFRFPNNVFNQILQQKLNQLNVIARKVEEIANIGSADGIIYGNQRLIEVYQYIASSINSFTPKNKSKKYLKSFKESMRSVVSPMMSEASKLKKDLKDYTEKNKLLSKYSGQAFNLKNVQGFNPEKHLLIMQRRGEL